MAGILCVWANLPDEANDWYLNHYIPAICNGDDNHVHVLHCDLAESGMEGQAVGVLDSPWRQFTVYEERDVKTSTESTYDKKNHPPDALRPGPLQQARFDVRTYREIKRWQQDGWDACKIYPLTI